MGSSRRIFLQAFVGAFGWLRKPRTAPAGVEPGLVVIAALVMEDGTECSAKGYARKQLTGVRHARAGELPGLYANRVTWRFPSPLQGRVRGVCLRVVINGTPMANGTSRFATPLCVGTSITLTWEDGPALVMAPWDEDEEEE